ncbi:MAG: hypothetical protein IJW23_00560 [Lentisphaeria bacterium]|nr:hypothetical protein [Lentisphaeria bacterium]
MMKQTLLYSALLASALVCADVRNGSFDRKGGKPPTQATVEAYRKAGIECPDAKDWTPYWGTLGKSGKIEFLSGGVRGRFVRLSKGACIRGYHGLKLDQDISVELYLRGKGEFSISFANYTLNGKRTVFLHPAKGIKPVYVNVDSDVWTRYTFTFPRPADVWNIHPYLTARKGTIDVDEVRIRHKGTSYLAVGKGEMRLRKEKLFITGKAEVALDANAKKYIEIFKTQYDRLKTFGSARYTNIPAQDLMQLLEELKPYVLTDGIKSIKVDHWNRMNALSYAVEEMTGDPVQMPGAPVKASAGKAAPRAAANPNAAPVAITTIKPSRIRYNENDKGSVQYTLVNNTGAPLKGTLQITMRRGLHDEKTLKKASVTLKPGAQTLTTSYNVGPETFGREIEVSFTSSKGTVVKKEYFQVAKEFMRVMMHGTGKYQNFTHFFASETSDFGIKKTDDLEYLSAQPRYHMRWKSRLPWFRHLKRDRGFVTSFYQAKAFAAQQGIEEVRKHPEFILYDENGQPAKDFFYGGIPDPFEIASPIEINKERRKKILDGRDFLDVRLSGWHHYIPDFTNLDCVEYATKCIRDYQKAVGFDVMYLDNTPTVTVGYTYEGKQNIAGLTPEQVADLNAKIAHAWNGGLRKDNPDAGSWCNGVNPGSARWQRSLGRWVNTAGMGVDTPEFKDPNDNFIRAMTSYSNIMLLSEVQHVFAPRHEIDARYPDKWIRDCLERRDYLVQKYKSSVVVGYLGTPYRGAKPMPRNTYWPTLSYFLATIAATQHHHIIYTEALPVRDAFDQFVTRYSCFIWDKELVAYAKADAKKNFKVESPKPLLWEDFVYNRKYADSEITVMHLVRPYPLKKWDLDWEIPATMLNNVKVTYPIPAGKKPVMAKAMRPNLPDEADQVVEKILPMTVRDGKVEVTVPAFSYYSMVAIKFQ